MRRALAVALALLLVLAPIAPVAIVGPAAAAPAGMSTIPDASVSEDVPDGASIPLSASELEGGVLASEHAGSLEVVLTTTEHAPTVMDSDAAAIDGNGMAVVLRDDEHSAGREVAIDAGKLQEALGYQPEAIHGTHEDGSEWTASAEYVDGYLVFDVPHFSSNTVTFSGEVSIDAAGAANDTQFEYEVASDEDVSDASMTVTGRDSTSDESRSWSELSDGDQVSIDVNGTTKADLNVEFSGAGSGFDGGAVFAVGSPADGNPDLIKYDTTDGFDLSTATHNVSGDLFQATSAGATFNADGTKFYTLNDGAAVEAIEFSLSKPYDPSTATETSRVELSEVGSYSGGGIMWNDDGSTLYIPDQDGYIQIYSASSAFDISTLSYDSQITLSDTGTPNGLAFNSDGTKAFVSDDGNSEVDEYSLSTPFDLSTASYTTSLDVSPQTSSLKDVELNNDGSKIYIGGPGTNEIYEYSLSTPFDLSTASYTTSLDVSDKTGGLNGLTWDGAAHYDMPGSAVDPSITIDGQSASYDGELTTSETHTETLSVSTGSYSNSVSLSEGAMNLNLSWTETTETVDPTVEIDSDDGSQTIGGSSVGTLSDGSTVDLSDEIDESRIGGSTTVTVTVDDPASGPAGKVDLNYSHSAQDQISTSYQASTFEETYNISHTYSDATENAQATIPFASSRVVGVKNVEYRVDGGSWQSVSPDNYRLDGTTLDVYLDDATGGVEAGQTVDVRATGRKISVENGAVTVTDPTAPGEDLDTQLQIDSRSPGFAVNVGPTDDGDRVHYAYADGFPTEDYVVIEANGDQQLYLPNAVTGDQFRVSHLDTRVIAERGDVRIDVVEAGQNPELDVSPGPGGSGDPVTIEYYNTESGVTYLLESLTRSIVVDSDTAQSPAIFEDDDSDETWSILKDTGGGSTSDDDGGAVGQFQDAAEGTVGSISLPISGSGLGQFALVAVLGLGAVFVLRRFWPFGDESGEPSSTATEPAASGSGSAVGSRLSALLGRVGRSGSAAAQTTGRGLLAGLQRVLSWLGNVLSVILGNRRASIAAGVIGLLLAARFDLFQLPEGTGILIVVSGVPLATWLIMRRSEATSQRVWLGSTLAAVILGLEFVAPGTVQTAIEQLTSENVAPLLILVGAGAIYLWYRARQSDRPQIIIGSDGD